MEYSVNITWLSHILGKKIHQSKTCHLQSNFALPLAQGTYFPLLETHYLVFSFLSFFIFPGNIHQSFYCSIQYVHICIPIQLYNIHFRVVWVNAQCPHHIEVDWRGKEKSILTVKRRKDRRVEESVWLGVLFEKCF